jgi:hypothetical protein
LLSGRARIIADRRQQNRIAQRVLVLGAADQSDGCCGAFERLTRAPAAGPDGLGADEIIQGFQGDARGKGRVCLGHITAVRPYPRGQARQAKGQ